MKPPAVRLSAGPPRAGASSTPLLLLLVALSLVGGIAGGLLRLGVAPASEATASSLGHAAAAHGALMIGGFLGTVIGIERAVALRTRWAFPAPFASGLGALFLLLGYHEIGAWLGVLAAAVFTAVNVVLVRRQWSAHTLLLLAAAGAWLVGNLLFAADREPAAIVPWWLAFLLMTIGAERVEMTRLMRRRPGAYPLLWLIVAAMLTGAGACSLSLLAGDFIYGASLLLLALWLFVFDIARRTVRAEGLSRYMAVCLLGGYAWLAVGGVAWIATALDHPVRDAALHGVGLGFVVSMMMGHAPVILPAIARIKLRFTPFFYVPLAALHLSLVVRLGWGTLDEAQRALGGICNAAAIALFGATLAVAALRTAAAPRSPR